MKLVGLILCVAAWLAAADSKTRPKLPAGRADLAAGKKLFENQCAICHGQTGEGGRGPVLARPRLSRAPDDASLAKVIEEGIRGTEMPSGDSMSEKEIRQVAAYVRTLGKIPSKPVPGDATRGAALYRGKGACAGCHMLNGEGGVSAPDLTGVGARRSAAYLKESILTPEAAVPDGYMLVTVRTRDGAPVTGVRANEDSFSIQLRDAAGRLHSFWKAEIGEPVKQRGKSPMPSYQGTLTDEEVTDLVAYLASLKEEK